MLDTCYTIVHFYNMICINVFIYFTVISTKSKKKLFRIRSKTIRVNKIDQNKDTNI